uniref:Anhydro-N-acetylmuramic acid kinase n=1 Tax=uncultured gamma proteobacterium HF0010_16J05 TaxID=710981 RepID=E0XR51_9GAMM|nr:predicted molecular chaperone distantly related to hsp70-fold metalloproteases [uncultured gamma proteobacterium HF0010_16J05]
MTSTNLYVGCMTGTSVDGLDLALIEVNTDGRVNILAADSTPLPETLRKDLLTLGQAIQPSLATINDIDLMGACDRNLGYVTAKAINTFLSNLNRNPKSIRGIGSHGQTIRHRPPGNQQSPFTLQIGDPNIIAELTQITTVADFRRRDMAAGGHGAPLVPRFHQALFSNHTSDACILNIGGISNVSLLGTNITGFDTGPGNGLMDQWCQQHLSSPFDKQGDWAAQGEVDEILLKTLLSDPYFSAPPPKSTGREYFNLQWLETRARQHNLSLAAAQDVQATLTQLTASSIVNALATWGNDPSALIICGGGRLNTDLVQRLKRTAEKLRAPPNFIEPSEHWGVDGDAVEAAAFAWLAHRRLNNLPGNAVGVTGADGERVLGAIY